jgi:hypothetical protein
VESVAAQRFRAGELASCMAGLVVHRVEQGSEFVMSSRRGIRSALGPV